MNLSLKIATIIFAFAFAFVVSSCSDEESLKLGLKTMSETVEFTTEDEVKKIVNS